MYLCDNTCYKTKIYVDRFGIDLMGGVVSSRVRKVTSVHDVIDFLTCVPLIDWLILDMERF